MADVRLQAKRDTVQIPLYSTEEAYYAARGVTTGFETNRQILVNMFPVVNKDPLRDDGGEVRLLSRPGLWAPQTGNSDISGCTTLTYSECMAVLGMKSTTGEVIIIALADYSAPNLLVRIAQYRPGVSTILIGSIDITAYGYTSHADVTVNLSEGSSGSTTALFVTIHPRTARSTSSNSDAFYATTTSGVFTGATLTVISDVDFPTNTPARGIVGPIVQLNNVHYVMTVDGHIYGSYPSNTFPFQPQITVWDTSGWTAAQQDADGGVAIVRYKHHLIAFGSSSMEFFNDEGLAKPNLPIMRTQQAFTKIGLANSKAWCMVDDELYWIGVSQDTGHIGLYKLSGYTPELVSSIPSSHQLTVYGRYSAELYSFSTMGTTHIITNVPHHPGVYGVSIMGADEPDNNTFTGTLVYCVTSKAWWTWAFEFTDYLSGVLSFGNDYAPQLRLAVTINGSESKRWIYTCAYKSSGTESFSVHPCVLGQSVEAGDYANFDKFRINNTSNFLTYRIPTAIRTNRLQFNSLNRKTIHKLKLQARSTWDHSNSFLPSEEWKLYVNAWKDTAVDTLSVNNSQATPDISRTIDLELPAYNPFLTMYNFGTCRSVMIQILSNNAYHLELGHLEATLTLADH